jgi:acetolactate synthase-1/3 small subunit
LVTNGSDEIIEQIVKQLNKLIDVIKLVDLTEGAHIEREMMLIKIRSQQLQEREELTRLVEIFRGRIIDVNATTFTIEITGDGAKLDAFIKALEQFQILETVRSGASGIARGEKSLSL